MLRLRQVVMVARDLRPAENQVCETLGLEVCYRDPGLTTFGLRHGLYPIGDRLLEIVAPKEPGTTAGRFLDRMGSDGGYMVIVQTDDLDRERDRIDTSGMRVVYEAQTSGVRGIHLHPKDVGGAILSIDQADPPESWAWAGHDWEWHSRTEVINDLVAVEIEAVDAHDLAARWATALDRPVSDGLTIALDDAELRFVPGEADRVSRFDVVASDRARAGELHTLCGTVFAFV